MPPVMGSVLFFVVTPVSILLKEYKSQNIYARFYCDIRLKYYLCSEN